MSGYVSSAQFVYDVDGKANLDHIVGNQFGVRIEPVFCQDLNDSSGLDLNISGHVVVCGSLSLIKLVVMLAVELRLSLGIIPLKKQVQLSQSYGLPTSVDDSLELALRDTPKDLDLVLCNEQLMLFKARIGRIPLIDSPENTSRMRIVTNGIRRLTALQLVPIKIKVEGNNSNELASVASGCLLFANPERIFASRIISHNSSFSDGLISMVIVAPISIFSYFRLMLKTLTRKKSRNMPESIGFIKSPDISIETEEEFAVYIDGEPSSKTPVRCVVRPAAIKINHGKDLVRENQRSAPGSEKFITQTLPKGKELIKARNKRVPFFTYASEERFRDLFVALRTDAQTNSTYLTLMVISTLLATVGLYMNSSSVIIGAMLLAPLMAPIISLAMGILRMDRGMFKNSLIKVVLGILVALFVAATFSMFLPYQPVTAEMLARLNPTVLDLAVAIIAGVAGAYTKSYKEILQSLAGVAIAVALVPPLATAGIGIGRLDWFFFSNAFLLFSTNFIGIVLAATFSFRVLGFSPVVKDKRGLLIICIFFIFITIPLFFAYQDITEKSHFEKSWSVERFLVNGKYLIVKSARLERIRNKQLLTVEVLARDTLTRFDLQEFKRKVKKNFSPNLTVRLSIVYIP